MPKFESKIYKKSRMGKGKRKILVSIALFLEIKNLSISFLALGGDFISEVLLTPVSEKVSCIHECLIVAACQKTL